ncbi:MAG: FAD-dependent oxidoreductase, partial [Phycisphaerae bacterium]|nr:FAD-dependent oxidoreductase [Phycisphaerae bacterium]
NCPVTCVRRHDSHVEVKAGPAESAEHFDEVILACHADQALALLEDPQPAEHELLSVFPYQSNTAVLHTDTSILPRRRRAWASWNYHLRDDRPDRSTVTYNMNMLQSLPAREVYCVTLNDDDGIDPARVIRRFEYHHPIYTAGRRVAQSRHHELIRKQRTSFCGAYWGFGFHEDGVNSGLAVARAFGTDLDS